MRNLISPQQHFESTLVELWKSNAIPWSARSDMLFGISVIFHGWPEYQEFSDDALFLFTLIGYRSCS